MRIDKRWRRIFSCILVICLVVILICVSNSSLKKKDIKDSKPSLSSDLTVIKQQNTDKRVIPDKYNTGVTSSNKLTVVKSGGVYNDVSFSARNNNKLALDFYYSNKNFSGDVVFENYDFSNYAIMMINENIDKSRNLKLIFKNCKLGEFASGKTDSPISYIFENCDITCFNGSNATFNNCHFGGTCSDALNIYRNVSVNNCYISNMSVPAADGTFSHTDGVQIYGAKNSLATNINFTNCRFEIPQLSYATSTCYVNACIMVQLEFCDADGIHFNDCYLNGGGYSIYAWDANLGYNLNDVTFKNINIGTICQYGQLFPKISDGVKIDYDTFQDTNRLYSSTVTRNKNKNETSITISNDTSSKKNFRVYTSSGAQYDYSIEECPNAKNVGGMTFDDFPFDRQFTIPEYCDWIVCFEVTTDSDGNESLTQIRYQNWGDEIAAIDLNNTTLNNVDSTAYMKPQDITSINSPTILEGECGKNVTFKLYETGELVLRGYGKTYNYNSRKHTPWHDYTSQISTIIIDDGITGIGSLCFKNIPKLDNIYIPEGVSTIGNNCFINCNNLSAVSLPSTITSIGSYAFWATDINKVDYAGTNNQKSDIIINQNNPSIITEELSYSDPKVINDGTCGKNINWSLYDDGTLILDGTGATNEYNSHNPVPWENLRNKIITIKVNDGITSLGSQIFSNCTTLTSVELPDSLTSIGSNSFMACSQLKSITLPKSVTTIGDYAFHNAGLKTVSYLGTSDDWNNIKIGTNNDTLINSAITYSK